MLKSMLMTFVEEMGHYYESLLDGAIEEKYAEVVETALVAANHQIAATATDDNKDENEDENEVKVEVGNGNIDDE